MNNHKPYFANLDAIRWIAALMVFLGHAVSPSYKYLHVENTIWEKLLDTISNGRTGVSIFFVLSGFLITFLLISEYELTATLSLKKFYIRRVLRIWPLYYLVVAFSFFIYPLLNTMVGINHPLASNVFYHLTFLSNFDIIRMDHMHYYGSAARSQDITWSVSIEEQFYLVWPLIFVCLPKRFWGYTILLSIIGSVLFRIANVNDTIVLYFHSLSAMLDLAIGGLLAYVIKSNTAIRNFFENSSTRTHLLLFMGSFCLVFWNDTLFSFTYGNAVGRIFTSLSFALIISAQALTISASKLNLHNWSFANNWGKYTYGIYLLHPIVMAIVEIILYIIHISPDSFITTFGIGMLELILTLSLSKFMFKNYESYFLNIKEKFTT
ncbi:MAG: acyltransferase [Bacteroidota bacterium]